MVQHNLCVRILGCGSSGGVPRIGNRWGSCDPDEPKNRRSRCSILVSTVEEGAASTKILVDTSPDMREQLLAAQIKHLDAVLFTHDHADQTHGLDDLRQIAYVMGQRVPVYLDAITRKTLYRRFGYAFEQPEDSPYPAILHAHQMPTLGETFLVQGAGSAIPVVPFLVEHGPVVQALGFRFGGIAYTPDVSNIPDESIKVLAGVDTWIIDALRIEPHPTHFNLDMALQWIERIKPRQAILTNMHIDLDYQTLTKELPNHIIPAHDGLELYSHF